MNSKINEALALLPIQFNKKTLIELNKFCEFDERVLSYVNSFDSPEAIVFPLTLEQDTEEATQIFKEFVLKNHEFVLLLFRAALSLHEKKDDLKKVVAMYQISAEVGEYSPAQKLLGHSYLCGIGVEKNFEKAVFWMNKAATNEKKPDPKAMLWLGDYYSEMRNEATDKDKSQYWYQQVATSEDNEDALYELALRFWSGIYLPKDIDAATKYAQIAASRKNDGAQRLLEKITLNEEPDLSYLNETPLSTHITTHDWYWIDRCRENLRAGKYDEAKEAIGKVFDKDYSAVSHTLGMMYFFGWGFDLDFAKAKRYWSRDENFVKLLDECKSKGVPEEFFEKLFHSAQKQGFLEAKTLLQSGNKDRFKEVMNSMFDKVSHLCVQGRPIELDTLQLDPLVELTGKSDRLKAILALKAKK